MVRTPPHDSRPRHDRVTSRHDSILRRARGATPDTARVRCRQCALGGGASRCRRRSRDGGNIRARARSVAPLLSGRHGAARFERVRDLPAARWMRARRHTLFRANDSTLAGGCQARRRRANGAARRDHPHDSARNPSYCRAAGGVALGGRTLGSLDVTARAGGSSGAVLSRDVLPARGRCARHVRRVVARREYPRPRGRGRAVAARRAAALVARGGRRITCPRRAVPRPLLRSRNRSTGSRRQPRIMALMAGGARGHRHGAHRLGSRAGARSDGAAAGVLAAARRVRMGGVGGSRWAVAVEPARGLAGVVHVSLAPRAGGCDRPRAEALGTCRHGRCRRNRCDAADVGRSRRRASGAGHA